ncbi:MAG TPA: cytochrome P460 family protein [Bryobacteraceae bacterium]|nr:cytochrome P460 family protein [Bryobacteraceae bacterium]
MKLQRITAIAAVGTSMIVAGALVAAQDRFTLQSPSGIAFSEFKGYEAWQMIAPSDPDNAGGCGTAPAPGCIKAILGNPAMIKAYSEGIPANGKPVPDGAVMAKLEWAKKRHTAPPYAATVPGALSEVSFMVKDSKRFPKTDGWGYATFRYDAATDDWKAFGDNAAFANKCHACHTLVKTNDFVFTDYPKR